METPIRPWLASTAAAVVVSLGLAAGPAGAQQQANTLDLIKQRGNLNCGVNTGLAGFAAPDSQGVWRGLDVDLCRAVAAALFGDATKVRYVPTTAQQRFTALQSGEVDILSRNTTWTLSRDTSLGLDFSGINFYDGQGFMVKRELGLKSAKELDGATVCVQPGTTTELNLTDWFRANNIRFTPVVIERLEEVNAAFFSGRCDALTTDVSGLASVRSTQGANAEQFVILPEVISKEPLGPAVRQGDPRWADLVRWAHFAMVEAEELGLTSANIDQHMQSANPSIQRFVGAAGELGQMLTVDAKWAYNIIKQVGNYGESFARNVTPLGIQRGPNELWTKGGLMYAPPMR
ncbi:amino acid ABC transporter substrate-binding protein [Elioraea rosea]|uniref:amino acid ABC transporter substrate-binding protein n=1 Tax=Elioraea rosea TaxID=2492390 RepID=UPI0011825766|nr:amino acid ABC transporter substrate-binding protein [Elioraea rosea]